MYVSNSFESKDSDKQLIINLSNFIKLKHSICSIIKLRYLDGFIDNANKNHSQSRGKVSDRNSHESNKKG